jgi:PHD/YefM family antitoxin component YafN of YafNO toxin-antitoxin module
MINIRPVSDLRNKYPEIEELVLKEDEAVYLTKNGYGSMVVMSIERYSKLMSDAEYSEYIENALDEAAEDPNTKYYTHEEMKKRQEG